MQIKYIASFLTLYEEQNISKTGAKLFISQQGVSRQIKTLEDELDTVLFERSKTGVTPTETCRLLYPYFKRLYGEYLQSLEVLEKHSKTARRGVSVAFAQGISNSGSADFIFEYQRLHPELKIEIQEWTQQLCIRKLLGGEIDVAFLVNPFDTTMFCTQPLAAGNMYAAMHRKHPLAGQRCPLDFSCLDGENIITGAPENALRQMFDYFCKLSGIRLNIIFGSNFSLNYLNAMTDNVGIATVTATMAMRVTNPDIVFRKLITPEQGFLYCCTPKDAKASREVTSLASYVERYFESNPLPVLEECE